MISLLFDMNALFEAYIERQLRRLPGVRIKAQAKKHFWWGILDPACHAGEPCSSRCRVDLLQKLHRMALWLAKITSVLPPAPC